MALNHLADGKHPYLQSNFIVGVGHIDAADSGEYTSMTLAKQKEILQDFRDKKFKFLVATNVLEEGIDVQSCNLVIRYDLITNFRSYVQAKGRARALPSFYILMQDVNDEEYISDILFYREIETALHSTCDSRKLPLCSEVVNHFADDPLTPYMPFGHSGPRISSTNCLSIVSRFCSQLDNDEFGRQLTPTVEMYHFTTNINNVQFVCRGSLT